jgi:hypothetical protein
VARDRDAYVALLDDGASGEFQFSSVNEEAVVAYRQSLRYRPNFYPAFFNLGFALTDGDRLFEARDVWEHAARPDGPPGCGNRDGRFCRLFTGRVLDSVVAITLIAAIGIKSLDCVSGQIAESRKLIHIIDSSISITDTGVGARGEPPTSLHPGRKPKALPWADEKEGFIDGVGSQRIDAFCRATALSARPLRSTPPGPPF